MPELPEVEVIRRGLAPQLAGRAVAGIAAGARKLRKPVPRARLKEWIAGGRIAAVERRAKFLLLRMESGALLAFHLGMTGQLALLPAAAPLRKHDHLRISLEGGLELRFNDARRFGFVEVHTPAELEVDPFAHLGPEPFGEELTAAYLLERASRHRKPVKCLLMDNAVVVGIGNIYASEILFAAGIHPLAPAAGLDRRHWQRVIDSSREVLARAIAGGGTTISDFVNAKGESGRFQHQLQVYGRTGLPCPSCQAPVVRTVIAGRATFHCPRCQSG
ncbi:MAG: bifunctional DNA-formamidopyrimidine glycosylase/DNA-(apurinic or apyrimidinic site) lyase [Desulfobacteraceae bacterium]|nr:bifunctional DNA-formamidopyrimidine glycosylase/DNA-(apurinic or apyrimidinic site) lyase [Desulfobacteraceae bacterium]